METTKIRKPDMARIKKLTNNIAQLEEIIRNGVGSKEDVEQAIKYTENSVLRNSLSSFLDLDFSRIKIYKLKAILMYITQQLAKYHDELARLTN